MDPLDRTPGLNWPDYLNGAATTHQREASTFSLRIREGRPSYVPVGFPPPIFTKAFADRVLELALRCRDAVTGLADIHFGGCHRKMLAHQRHLPEEQEFLERFLTPRLRAIGCHFSRPDILITANGLAVVEVNFGAALGGLGLMDRVSRVMAETGYQQHLLDQLGLSLVATATMRTWRQSLTPLLRSSPENGHLFVALAAADEVEHPRGHMLDFVDGVREFGHEVTLGLFHELQVTTHGVFHHGRRIDVVYAMCTYREMRDHGVPPALLLALAEADERYQVDFIGSPASVVFDSKMNLALLPPSDELLATLPLDLQQAARIAPDWRRWVLKPAGDFGGAQVRIGQDLSASDWDREVSLALSSGVPSVLQLNAGELWTWAPCGDRKQHPPMAVCLGPVLVGDDHAGTLLRQAPSHGATPVINVAQGGQAGTFFVAESLRTEAINP